MCARWNILAATALAVILATNPRNVEAVPPFSATCSDVQVEAYRYETDINGKVITNHWSRGEKFSGGKWKFLYTGEDKVVVDGEPKQIVAAHGGSLLVASPLSAPFGAGVWVYAIHTKLRRIVAAQVHVSESKWLGGAIKTRSVQLEYDFSFDR